MGTSAAPSRHRSATALAAVGVLTFEPSASVIVVAMRPLSGRMRRTFAAAAQGRRMSSRARKPTRSEVVDKPRLGDGFSRPHQRIGGIAPRWSINPAWWTGFLDHLAGLHRAAHNENA